MTYFCNLCPRNCNAVRTEKENVGGFCGMPYKLKVARAAKHFWEEPCISGENGSGTIFFSGCQLKCSYCQNFDISHGRFGKEISVQRLAEIFRELEEDGAININLISATQFVPLIIEAFDIYKPNIPVVFNSGGYESVETLEMLRDYVDIFLLDFKYWSNEKAEKYSCAINYPSVVKSVINKAYEIAGPPQFDGNIMTKGVIVRHLLLPSATKECIEIMNYLKESGLQIIFSLMNQYTVIPNLKHQELSRKVTVREYEKVADRMMNLGLEGYIQEKTSSGDEFIPDFDLSGV